MSTSEQKAALPLSITSVKTLQSSLQASEERYYNAISNQQDRVDKNLVKNLVLNYVQKGNQSATNRNKLVRSTAVRGLRGATPLHIYSLSLRYLRVLSEALSERTQVLRILSKVLDFNQQECERLGLVRGTASADSLAREFVRFLEKESKPAAPLPSMMGERLIYIVNRKRQKW
ncbi:hypothetical protein EVAR_79183_1 [Eumeta japonica]|uniref:GRIP domain-containing protein n=1 Tax=Eumeta variegata TaxID=151549 RepID=A0A4C1UV09_EUMVA|nr:hypothetical protein EVAR_79183_1 [Eumeta japonica]